jgi:hypothetical protein
VNRAPGFIGKKLCPELVLVKTNMDKYQAESKKMQGRKARAKFFDIYDARVGMCILSQKTHFRAAKKCHIASVHWWEFTNI